MPTVGIHLPLNENVSGTYLLFLYSGSTLLNSGGDTLTEVDNGYFTATVAETIDATVAYRADVTRNGTLLYSGWLQSGVSSVVDDPGANIKAVLGVAVTPTSLPVDANVVDIGSDVVDEIAAAIDCSGAGGTPGIIVPRTVSDGTDIWVYQGETITQTLTVLQSDGETPLDLSGKTLVLLFETLQEHFVDSISPPSATGADNNIVTFAYTEDVTRVVRDLVWSLRDAANPRTVYLSGILSVKKAATRTS